MIVSVQSIVNKMQLGIFNMYILTEIIISF